MKTKPLHVTLALLAGLFLIPAPSAEAQWREHDWLEWIYQTDAGGGSIWWYHEQLGWVWPAGNSGWFYDAAAEDWFWTGPGVWRWVWYSAPSAWFYLWEDGTRLPLVADDLVPDSIAGWRIRTQTDIGTGTMDFRHDGTVSGSFPGQSYTASYTWTKTGPDTGEMVIQGSGLTMGGVFYPVPFSMRAWITAETRDGGGFESVETSPQMPNTEIWQRGTFVVLER